MRAALTSFGRTPLARRLLGGVAANALGKLWVLLTQVVAVPVLTARWGGDSYGIWLMLTTIPTFLSLSDFGLGSAATVEITKQHVTGDQYASQGIFQSTWLFVTAASILVATIIFVVALCAPPFRTPQPPHVGSLTLNTILIAVYSIAVVQTQLISIVYRSTGRYASGTFLLDTLTLVESIFYISVAAIGANITLTIVAMLAARVLLLIVYYFRSQHPQPWITIGFAHATLAQIKQLATPSAAALMLTMANALALQGVISTLGATAGATAVAAFATARFIARAPLQMTSLVSRATLPELTRAQHSDNRQLTIKLLMLNVGSAMAVSVPATLALLILTPALVAILSHGTLKTDISIAMPIVLASLFNSLWTTLATPLIATNRYTTLAATYLLANGVVVFVPFLAPKTAVLTTSWTIFFAELMCVALVAFTLRRALR